MKRFRNYVDLTEGKKPLWLKIVVGGMVLKIQSLSNRIQTETDPLRQNYLISQQNNLISYIVGLGIGVNSKDPQLTNAMKRGLIRRKVK